MPVACSSACSRNSTSSVTVHQHLLAQTIASLSTWPYSASFHVLQLCAEQASGKGLPLSKCRFLGSPRSPCDKDCEAPHDVCCRTLDVDCVTCTHLDRFRTDHLHVKYVSMRCSSSTVGQVLIGSNWRGLNICPLIRRRRRRSASHVGLPAGGNGGS